MLLRHHFEHVCAFAEAYDIHFIPDEFDIIRTYTKREVLPAYTVLMEQGKKVDKLYFLNRGIARLYRVHNDVDHTLGIVSGNYFLSTPLYLQSGEISTCSLESLSEIDVLIWEKESALHLKKHIPKMEAMDLAVMDTLLRWLQDIQINSICMTAEERYIHLMETQPLVIQQVPLKYIASFLAIHQDSLSRIRKHLVHRS
ncbi:Crp/Fnr family transcriptional regulator [Sphingobacterium chuzhouense]|uniref:Crp/Fnr family transcriptional regulator n=1 Tax=Sphingobacterium chuzhouense TaxID=1742264 RepID=A0ABR7XN31_9SPHI|nr:cyclic nucleotide-binding domain-containing protein [Sphingobacterium chuzhouense]MBD1420571.1 Crp/Fnr family transcriptional regulator [Sphingobacterium chuzhouense]